MDLGIKENFPVEVTPNWDLKKSNNYIDGVKYPKERDRHLESLGD